MWVIYTRKLENNDGGWSQYTRYDDGREAGDALKRMSVGSWLYEYMMVFDKDTTSLQNS